MPSFRDQVIDYTTHIEERLEALGGSGGGLREKAENAQPPLNRHLIARIRKIGMVRNPLVHERGYQFEGSESEFLALCESVLIGLGAQPQKLQSMSNSNAEARNSLDQAHMGGAMDNTSSNIWVEVDDENIRGNTYESTIEKRLVFYAGGGVTVKPIGKHKAGSSFSLGGFLPTVDAIGLIKMTSGHIKITSNGGITTSDGIPVEIEIILSIKVLDNVPAITRVALDANAEQILIRNSALTELRTVIGKYGYQNLNAKLSEIEREVKETMLLNKQQEFSFEVSYVSIQKATANDAVIGEHALRIAQVTAEKAVLEHSQELLKMKFDAENAKRVAERNAELQYTKDIAAINHLNAEKQVDQQIRLMEKGAEKEIELAKIQAKTEEHKFNTKASQDNMKLIVDVVNNRGQQDVLLQLFQKQYGITLNANDSSSSNNLSDAEIVKPPPTDAKDKPSTPTSADSPPAESKDDQPG